MGDSEVVGLLREVAAWQRFAGETRLRDVLKEMLRTDNDLAVYALTDGGHSQRAIADEVGITLRAVNMKWAAWRDRGILIEGRGSEHPKHLASVDELGGLPV